MSLFESAADDEMMMEDDNTARATTTMKLHERPEVKNKLPYPQSCHSTLGPPHHSGPILCVRFSHSHGDYLLSGGFDRSIHLWNPLKGTHIKAYPLQHGREILDLQLTSQNTKFVSGSADRLAMLWDVSTGEVLRRLRGHDGAVNSVALNGDDSLLATAGYDQRVCLWDVRAFSRDPIQTLRDAKDSVTCVRINDCEIATTSMDGCLRRYDLRSAKCITDHLGSSATSVEWSHDGECLLVSCLDSTRKLVDKSTGKVLNEYSARGDQFTLESCFDNTDGYITCGDEDGTIRIFDLITAKEVHRYENAHGDKAISSLVWHPKSKQFASAGQDGKIRFWK